MISTHFYNFRLWIVNTPTKYYSVSSSSFCLVPSDATHPAVAWLLAAPPPPSVTLLPPHAHPRGTPRLSGTPLSPEKRKIEIIEVLL